MTVSFCEVGPRDGLQNEPTVLTPAARAELVDRLVACGVRRLEATSFVHPDRVPAMAHAEEVVARITPADVVYAGLVLNERGYERLRATALDEVRMVVPCTDAFGERNQNAGTRKALVAAARIAERAHVDGIRFSVTLAVAFGCPFEGRVDAGHVFAVAEDVLALAPDELVLADTIGVAAPREVGSLVAAVVRLGVPIGVHFHDTRNTGVANTYAALDAGAVAFDAAVGGTGGCPFAPGAAGNVASEDVLYVLERDGVDLGIDLDGLIDVANHLAGLLGHPLAGHLQRVGLAA